MIHPYSYWWLLTCLVLALIVGVAEMVRFLA